jgi:Effector-associated domain 1
MGYVRLSGPQQLELQEALYLAYGAGYAGLVLALNRDPDRYKVEGNTLVQNILALMKAAEEGLWLDEFVALAARSRPGDLRLAAIAMTLDSAALPIAFDPYEMCCLTGDYIMVNRARLRTVLKAMGAHDAKRILVVRDLLPSATEQLAGTKTGKSLTVQFISALSQQLRTFEFIWIDLRAFKDYLGPMNDIRPVDLAKRLVRLLRYEPSVVPDLPSDAQWSRWSLDFCDSFEAEARSDPRQLWLVVDEFNKVALSQETIDLIKQLADRIRVTLPQFRLMLLGFRDTLSPQVHPHVEEDHVERRVSASEVITFFKRALRQRQLVATDEMIIEAAANTLGGLDPELEDYLEELSRRSRKQLLSLADHIVAGPPREVAVSTVAPADGLPRDGRADEDERGELP